MSGLKNVYVIGAGKTIFAFNVYVIGAGKTIFAFFTLNIVYPAVNISMIGILASGWLLIMLNKA